MHNINIAEWILALVTTRDRAASTVGDLAEGAATRGAVWFWSGVLRTAASLLWRDIVGTERAFHRVGADRPGRLHRDRLDLCGPQWSRVLPGQAWRADIHFIWTRLDGSSGSQRPCWLVRWSSAGCWLVGPPDGNWLRAWCMRSSPRSTTCSRCLVTTASFPPCYAFSSFRPEPRGGAAAGFA